MVSVGIATPDRVAELCGCVVPQCCAPQPRNLATPQPRYPLPAPPRFVLGDRSPSPTTAWRSPSVHPRWNGPTEPGQSICCGALNH